MHRYLPGRRQAMLRIVAIGILLLLVGYYAMATWHARAPFGEKYPYANNILTDFRDTALLPNKAIDKGVDPYDIHAYQTAFPNAQEFDPYMPWWLTATAPLAHLDWKSSSLLWSVILAGMTTLTAMRASILAAKKFVGGHLSRSSIGTYDGASETTIILISGIFIWAWRPTSIGQGLGNIGAVAALAAIISLWETSNGYGAVALMLAWIKPQFGIPVVILLLFMGLWRRAIYGTLLAAMASIPAMFRLSNIEGGLLPLIRVVINSTGTLGSRDSGEPMAGRIDLSADLAMITSSPTTAPAAILGLILLVFTGIHGRRHPISFTTQLLQPIAILLCLPHLHYDLALEEPCALIGLIAMGSAVRNRFKSHGEPSREKLSIQELLPLLLILTVGIFPGNQILTGNLWAKCQAIIMLSTCIILIVEILPRKTERSIPKRGIS